MGRTPRGRIRLLRDRLLEVELEVEIFDMWTRGFAVGMVRRLGVFREWIIDCFVADSWIPLFVVDEVWRCWKCCEARSIVGCLLFVGERIEGEI